jgi:uncharacterized protein involved in tolerance to divalent cations
MSESIDLRVDLIEAERQIFNLREDVRCSDAACGRLRERLAACVTARDEANAAWSEKVQILLREGADLRRKLAAALEATK